MLGRLWTLLALRRNLRLGWRLLRDPRVPILTKTPIPMALLLIISPPNLVVDFIPILGQLDVVTLLLLSLWVFIRLCPSEVVREHLEAMAGRPRETARSEPANVIDGEYKILK